MEQLMETWLPHPHNRPKLLIVDDQSTNIRVLHELFREDCDVFMATSGEQAITVCQTQLPDLILLDVVMDDVDGHEVCRRLKADPVTQGIPIIFITAQQRDSDEALGLELGAVDFISKPINPIIVRARVRTHLTLKLQNDLLRSMALMDGLTGVANRRKFDEDISADWRQCFREQKPLSLILADVDYFKRYNDRYGHLAGDGCLKSVAQALKWLDVPTTWSLGMAVKSLPAFCPIQVFLGRSKL
jgi:PleD family two-component response regulator